MLAGLAGIAFIVFGVVGFMRTGVGDWAQHAIVLGFSVNPLHNLVHVIIGVLGLLMALGSGLARLYGWLLFPVTARSSSGDLMITGVVAQNPIENYGNPLALNMNDNWLHFALTLFGLLLAVLPARRKLIEEVDEEPELPQQRSAAFRENEKDNEPHVEPTDPAVSTRSREPITQEQAVVDPKTDRVSKDKIKH